MSPHCDDEIKYSVIEKMVAEYEGMAGKEILGRKVVDVNTVNGARVTLEDGSWLLVRASSNKPELVVVVESLQSEDDMRDLFRTEVKPRLGQHKEVGAYTQDISGYPACPTALTFWHKNRTPRRKFVAATKNRT